MMRGKIIAALAAALLTVTAGVLAQTGGFPSRPRFQSVGVGTSAPATVGRIVATTGQIGSAALDGNAILAIADGSPAGQIAARGAAAGAANIAYTEFQDSTGATMGYIGDGSSGNSDIHLAATANGANVVLIPGTGGAVLIGSIPILRTATCNFSSAGTAQSNCYGMTNATVTGTGAYTLNFSPAFTQAPVCVASGDSGAGKIAIANGLPSLTQGFVRTYDVTGAATNSNFTVACSGR